MKKKLYFRIKALALAILLVLTGFVITPQQVQADTTSIGDELSSQVAEGSSATEFVTDESFTTPESNQERQNESDMADTEDENSAESHAERSFEQIDETDPLSDVLSETEQTSSDVVAEQTEQEVVAEQTEQEIITDISDALDTDDTETAAEDKNRTITYTPEEDFEFDPATGTITYYKGKNPVINIPSCIGGVAVERIGKASFKWRMDITSVTIPDSVTVIEQDAFYDSRLTYLKLGKNIETIEDDAFYNNKLTSVTLPNSITSMGWCVFDSNELTSTNIPSGLTEIAFGVFRDNQLTSITIPDNVSIIGGSAFKNNKLEHVTISKNVTRIKENAFAYNNLTDITLPSGITQLEERVFKGNKFENFTIPENIVFIGKEALADNLLTSITIPDNVAGIGPKAFFNNQLTSVTIPNNVRKIAVGAFQSNPVQTASIPDSIETFEMLVGEYYYYDIDNPSIQYISEKCFDPGVSILCYIKVGSDIRRSSDGQIIETLKMPIYVTGKFNGEYLQFFYKGQNSYAHNSVILGSSPAITGYAKSTANVRNSPSGSVTGTILRGHKVSGTLVGNWVRFTYSGKICYVYSSMLQADPIKITRYIYANSIIRSAPNGSMITKLWRPLLINGT
ncbi:MAG: leucine-rich repeat protein, partial [Saccharofermentanales bacterium]